jgi:radical SAM protein with 4Fe4S-binding SPASM domain
MMKLQFNEINCKSLSGLIGQWRRKGIRHLEIETNAEKKSLLKFSKIAPFLYKLLDGEAFFGIWLKNIPFCTLTDDSRDHIVWDGSFRGEKLSKCQRCFYYKRCGGFPAGYFKKYGESEVKPIKDLPVEIMIEVEPRCNFACQFCFNKISFAKNGRNIKPFSTDYVKKIIDEIAGANVGIIRFTGGEPLLRADIFQLMEYAKNKNLEVRLNTNGSLITKATIIKLKDIIDNVLIPIESHSAEKEAALSSKQETLSQKINAIKLLKNAGTPVVRVGTVTTKENILNLEKLAMFIFNLPVDEWELYRPISAGRKILSRKDINILVDKLIKIRQKTKKNIFIANAVPFCAAANPNKINNVSKGALFDDGHKRMVIDPRGFVKPHYFLDKKIGDPLNVLKAWKHPFMRKMRNLEYLPATCSNCRFKQKCRGGSRYEAQAAGRSYYGLDPLAQPLRKEV